MRESDYDENAYGFSVRFIVIGTPEDAATFCGKFGERTRCIADPTKATYKAMSFGDYNFLRLFSDPALKARRAENAASGFTQDWGATKLKNGAQLPGAAAIDAHGMVRWLYRGKHPGDLPPMSEMLAVARATVQPKSS